MEWWSDGVMGSENPRLHCSITPIILSQIDVRAHPIVRRCRVSLAGRVFGKENVAWIKAYAGAVSQTDIDTAGQRDDPAAIQRTVIVDDMRCEFVSEQQSLGGAGDVEKLGADTGVQQFEMRLLVSTCVESINFHDGSPSD